MAHLHEVRDTDNHYKINPLTMEIESGTPEKNTLQQGDHACEIYTFELPKKIEGHDMTLCNLVEIHFINIAADKANKSEGVYKVKDMAVAEDEEGTLLFTWEVREEATMFAGSVNYRIKFACVDENGIYTYRKWTKVFKGVLIEEGFDNAESIEKEHSDILSEWEARLDALEENSGVTDYNALQNKPITRIESLDQNNLVNLRDLDSGQYILYGYFSPYANSDISISADNSMVSVIYKTAGSHIICLDPLNAKIVFFEILVDENEEKGYSYTRTIIPVLDLYDLISKVGDLEALSTEAKESLVAAINELAEKPTTTSVDFTNWSNGTWEETLSDGSKVTHTVTFDDSGVPTSIDGATIIFPAEVS